jgi:pimeloyl-ACP methyl ester carboxylesterase
MTESVRSLDGTTIAFSRSGDGPPLLTVGGALADATAVAPLLPHLEPHFTVCAVDRRGRGQSGDTAPYAVEREVEDLAAVIEAVGEGSYVYGHSSGATLTLEAASRGVRIGRAAVYEPPFIVDEQRPRPPADLPERLASLIAENERDEAVRVFLREGPGLTDAEIDQMRAAPFWQALLGLAPTVAYDAAVVGECYLPRERFAALDMPTLLLAGGASPGWILAGAQALAGVLPLAELSILPGQTHSAAPDVLSDALVGYFANGHAS